MDRLETIAAISTPRGEGGIGIVRISGPQALDIARLVFSPPRGTLPSDLLSHRVHYGFVHHPRTRRLLDEVLLLVLRAPRSYTGEDVVELQGHGGSAATSAVLEAVLASGARLADPGEFTRRAFLHGRIDLSQAEAVLDLIRARTDEGREAALEGLGGSLSELVAALREGILKTSASVEAELDADDDHPEAAPPGRLGERLDALLAAADDLLARSRHGALFREGVTAVIAGRPNVGKSSLLNAMLAEDRAIVTPHPGTTRDSIEGWMNLRGIPLCLVDGAGIRMAPSEVEEAGIRRAVDRLLRAGLVIVVLDTSAPLEPSDRDVLKMSTGKNVLVALNKIDLPRRLDAAVLAAEFPRLPAVEISCLRGTGIGELQSSLYRLVAGEASSSGRPPLSANPRQREVIERTLAHLAAARDAARDGSALDAVAAELRWAREALGEITGTESSEELLERIFSQFCIGK